MRIHWYHYALLPLIPKFATDRCVDCPIGKFGNQRAASSSSACVQCMAGKFSNTQAATSDGVCQVCGPNLFSGAGSTTCQFCPMHSVSQPATPSVSGCTCIAGFIQRQPGETCYNPNSGLFDFCHYPLSFTPHRGPLACLLLLSILPDLKAVPHKEDGHIYA